MPSPKDPTVVRVMHQFRADLMAREASTMQTMTRRWLGVEERLNVLFEATVERAQALQAEGKVLTQAQLFQLDRYRAMTLEAREQFTDFANWAGDFVGSTQLAAASDGLQAANEALAATFADQGTNRPGWRPLNVEAANFQAGFAGDGTPLGQLIAEAWPQAAQGITQELINGVALGHNPRRVARAMANGYSAGLDRSLTIARTEALRSYREMSRAQYQASGLVRAYQRLATRDHRTCIACLVKDGQTYDLREPLDEHPNGRCALVPVVHGFRPLEWQRGASWFEDQSEATQRDMLGGKAFDLWKAGRITLPDLVGVHTHPDWGDAIHVRSAAAALEAAGG